MRGCNQDIGHFLVLEREKWYGSLINKPDGEWNSAARIMMKEFAKSGYSVFKCSFPLSRGVLERKKGKDSIHCNADPSSADSSIQRVVLTWYLEKRSEGYDVTPNTDLKFCAYCTTRVALSQHSFFFFFFQYSMSLYRNVKMILP